GKPSLAMAPGLRFCTNTSALARIAARSALSSSRARSSTRDSLPRLSHTKYALWPSPGLLSRDTPTLPYYPGKPPSGRSTLIARAPASARRQVHTGAATACSSDTTSRPERGKGMGFVAGSCGKEWGRECVMLEQIVAADSVRSLPPCGGGVGK